MRWQPSLPLIFLTLGRSADAFSRYPALSALESALASEGRDGAAALSVEALVRLARSAHTAGTAEEEQLSGLRGAALAAFLRATGDCDLCGGEQQWLLVLAKNQSVAKPALDILNAVPGFHLTGESRSLAGTLLSLYQTARQINERNLASDPAWKSKPISERHLLCALQLFARELVVGLFEESTTRVIGFDEVWNASDGAQLDFLSKLFPCGRFVVSTGGLALEGGRGSTGDAGNAPSAMALNKVNEVDPMAPRNETLQSWHSHHQTSVFLMQASPEEYSAVHFNSLLQWLGVRGCHFEQVGRQQASGEKDEETRGLRLAAASVTKVAGDCRTPRWTAG